MSFQSKFFWLPRDAGCLTNRDLNCDTSSRIEPKRHHQQVMDASELERFCNKRQEIEAASSIPMSGNPNAIISQWDYSSNFQGVKEQFADRLFGSEMLRTSNLVDRSIPAVGTGNFNMERKGFEGQFLTDSVGHSSTRGYSNISIGAASTKTDNNILLGLTFNRGEENTLSMGPAFTKNNNNFVSTGQTFDKGDGSYMFMGQNYNRGYDNGLPMNQPFDKEDGAFVSMGHRYENENGNIVSPGYDYDKGCENLISTCSAYNEDDKNFISVGPSYYKVDDNNVISMLPTSDKADTEVISICTTYDKGISRISPMGQNHKKAETNTMSFRGFQNAPDTNPSGGTFSDNNLMARQTSKAPRQEDSAEYNTGPIHRVAPSTTSKQNATPKSKESKPLKKKVPPNNFPSNVKCLLSTGIFDGVPVKYVSWSRAQDLKGIIKGTGYLCGCNDCKFSKSLNAYEFERHAGCKTKHPNNHIYFENGTTIYAVVQELKSTPQDMLFEAIPNITGSPINQKNFRAWKASYQAATRELQRIYGKDELILPS